MQKGPHLVCGMFMLVGAEKKIMGWRNEMLGPGKKRWLTPAMPTSRPMSTIYNVMTIFLNF